LEFSLIGNNNKDPIKGIINNNVSIKFLLLRLPF
jgi:hypothetical protein